MYCVKCGAEVKGNFCSKCGAKIEESIKNDRHQINPAKNVVNVELNANTGAKPNILIRSENCTQLVEENKKASDKWANLEEAEKAISDNELYIKTNQAAITAADEQVKKVSKTTLIVVLLLIAAFILGVVIYFANLYKPVIDEQLLGSWQSSGYGYSDVWTFEKDGTYSMERSGTGIFSDDLDIDEWYYRAEDGKLKTSWSKNVDKYVSATYEYQFGVSENGTKCLILTKHDYGSGESTEILYKID